MVITAVVTVEVVIAAVVTVEVVIAAVVRWLLQP